MFTIPQQIKYNHEHKHLGIITFGRIPPKFYTTTTQQVTSYHIISYATSSNLPSLPCPPPKPFQKHLITIQHPSPHRLLPQPLLPNYLLPKPLKHLKQRPPPQQHLKRPHLLHHPTQPLPPVKHEPQSDRVAPPPGLHVQRSPVPREAFGGPGSMLGVQGIVPCGEGLVGEGG